MDECIGNDVCRIEWLTIREGEIDEVGGEDVLIEFIAEGGGGTEG